MRVFVAVDLPAPEKTRVMAAFTPIRRAGMPFRWIEPEAAHLTLQFLGQVDDPVIGAIRAALRVTAARHTPFSVQLRGAGVFPDVHRPAVLWLGVAPCKPLLALQSDVARALAALDFEPERRPFHPHVTVARARRDAARQAFAGLAALVPAVTHEASISVDEVHLMQSHLSRTGARYESVAAARLGEGNTA